MDKRLLVVAGPTATGKTPLGIRLARKFNGQVISADSRQVFKEMDVGTGKDLLPAANYKKVNKKVGGYYLYDETKVWGYDLVSPKDKFSVAEYVPIAREIIRRVWKKRELPILVGGTGLYIKGVVDGIETSSIPQNKRLRERLEGKKVEDLYEHLAKLSPIKAASLNASDRKNPRRLIRAIEIAQWEVKGRKREEREGTGPLNSETNTLFIGLTAKKEELCERIGKRVEERIEKGIKEEIRKLLEMGVGWEDQAMDSLGYKQWRGHFEQGKKEDEIVKEWVKDECQYAKRQITWFKRDKRINWFDVYSKDYPENVEKTVKKWYNEE